MANIIDELIVTLRLDTSKFNEEQRKSVEQLRKFGDAAERSSKKSATAAEGATQAFAGLQGRLLSIAGLFLGGMGIQSFTEHITRLTAQTGFLSKSLGISVTELGKWEAAGATVGASASEIASGLAAIQKNMARFQLHGESPLHALAYLSHQSGHGPAINLQNPDRSWKSPTEILTDMSRYAAAQPNKAIASEQLFSTGMPAGMVNMLLLGPQELQKRLKEAEKYAPTPEQVKRFQALQQEMAKASMSAERLGRALAELLTPQFIKFADAVTKIIDAFSSKGAVAGLSELDKAASEGTGGLAIPQGKTKPAPYGGTGVISGAKRLYHWGRRRLGLEQEETPASASAPATGGAPASTGPRSDATLPRGAQARTALAKSYFADQLRSEGVPAANVDAAASLLAGQAIAESNLNPNLSHDSGTGYGIYGARLGRRARMLAWLKANGYAANSLEGQARYMAREAMNDPTYRASRNALMTATPESMAAGTRTLTRNFEAPRIDNSWSRYHNAMGALTIGARAAASAAAPMSTVNNSTASTHIGNMHVTVPAGADPVGYANGIRQELQRYNNVMNAQTGLE